MGIWCLNTNNTKRLLPKTRVNLMRRRKKWPKNLGQKKTQNRNQKKKFLQKPGPKFFRTFSLSTRTHHYKKNCTVFFLATGIMILKNTKIYTTMLAFFLFCDNALLCKAF